MKRFKAFLVLGVLVGTLIFGLTMAYGVWWWNSTVDVEGSELRTVWEILDDADCAYCYSADVTIRVPKEANAEVVEQGTNESVSIQKTKKLDCLSNGIETTVNASISGQAGATGTQAKVTLIVDGAVVSEQTGAVGSTISQDIVLPSTCGAGSGGGSGNGNGGGKGKKK